MKIDFAELGMPVFTGRARGTAARRKLSLGSVREDQEVTVIIPDNVYAITSSYFLGLFGPSVRSSGSVDQFFEQFKFSAPAHIQDKLADFALRALREPKDLLTP